MVNVAEKKVILWFSLLLITVVSILNYWALNEDFYFLYWWFDIMMHFLGGLWVSLTFLWFYFLSGIFGVPEIDRKNIFWPSLIVLIAVAISWEIFELYVHNTYKDPKFISDTTIDIILGIIGAFVSYRYFTYSFLEQHGK